MDKNNDGFVTLNELNDFKVAVFKEKQLTQDEVRTQQWTLKNLFPKDMLGSDNQFDFDEYWYYMNTLPITSEPGWTTPSPPTTKRNIFSKFFSEKPQQFWDPNGDGRWTPPEVYRFKMTPEEFKDEFSYRFKVK